MRFDMDPPFGGLPCHAAYTGANQSAPNRPDETGPANGALAPSGLNVGIAAASGLSSNASAKNGPVYGPLIGRTPEALPCRPVMPPLTGLPVAVCAPMPVGFMYCPV